MRGKGEAGKGKGGREASLMCVEGGRRKCVMVSGEIKWNEISRQGWREGRQRKAAVSPAFSVCPSSTA